MPLKTKEKGIVGKPAEPTVAPGGSVAAAAWVAGAGGVAPRRPAWPTSLPTRSADGLAPPVAAVAAGAADAAGVGPWPPLPAIFSEVKSIRAECATDCSW